MHDPRFGNVQCIYPSHDTFVVAIQDLPIIHQGKYKDDIN